MIQKLKIPKDDFVGITSQMCEWCHKGNKVWRRNANKVGVNDVIKETKEGGEM